MPDWKFWIELVVAVAAVAGFGLSLLNYFRENARWKDLNMGRVEISRVGFIYFKILPKEESLKTDWGYRVDALEMLEDRRLTGLVGIPHRIIAFDESTKTAHTEINGITYKEAEERLRNAPSSRDHFILIKVYEIEFTFENVGNTAARNVSISIERQMPDTGKWEQDKFSSPRDLPPRKTVQKLTQLYAPLNSYLLEKLQFKVHIQYEDVAGEKVYRTEAVYFNAKTAAFMLGQVTTPTAPSR